ncbi:hypothetical protein BBJ28_00023567 [Nothophytophthora sp. Chile5]|nr:hypothetical protein BBJ28_00023567 [Nothophytophthora sp. Chile5]
MANESVKAKNVELEDIDGDSGVDVDAEARLCNVTRGMKEQADQLLLAGQLDKALQLYRELLMHLTRSQVTLLREKELVISCRMNVLAALSKAQRWAIAVTEATETLAVFAELQAATKKQGAEATTAPPEEDALVAQVLSRAYYFRGFAHMRMGTFALAEQDFRRAMTLSPQDETLQSDWKELQAAMQAEQKVKQLLATSMKFFQAGKYQTAVEACLSALRESQVLQKSELTGLIHGNLAAIYVKAKDDAKAIEHYKRTMLLARGGTSPTTAQNERVYDILDSLAGCYSRKRDYSSALSVVEDQIKLLPRCPGRSDREGMMHLNGGRVCYTLGKFAQAEEHLEKGHKAALKATNQIDVALNCAFWLSKACIKNNKAAKAMEILDVAIPTAEKEVEADTSCCADVLEKLLLARLDLLDPDITASSSGNAASVSPLREAQLWHTLEYFEGKRQIYGHLRAAEALINVLQVKHGVENAEGRTEMLRALKVVDRVNIGKLSTSEALILMKLALCKVDLVVGSRPSQWQEAKALLVKLLRDLELPGGADPSRRQQLRAAALRRLVDVCETEDKEESDVEIRGFLEEAVDLLRDDQTAKAKLGLLLSSIGRWKAARGEVATSEEMLEESVELLREAPGDDSGRLCEALVGLCVVLMKLGRIDEAMKVMAEIETIPRAQERKELVFIKNRLRAAKEEAEQKQQHVQKADATKEKSPLLDKWRLAAGSGGGSVVCGNVRQWWGRWCGALLACVVAVAGLLMCA